MSMSALASYMGTWTADDGKMTRKNGKLYGAITYNALQSGTSKVLVTSYSSYKYNVEENNGILTASKDGTKKKTSGTIHGCTSSVDVNTFSKPIENRLDRIEEHLELIEVCLDRVEERLDKVEERLEQIEQRLDK